MPFGMVLQENTTENEDGEEVKKIEKIKTREGKTTKLSELLDEAKNRAIKMFEDRQKSEEGGSKMQVDPAKIVETAETMGISAIKYFDLKQNRVQNYVFSFDKMLDPKGNTGVYLLYMFVRICSIMEKSTFGTHDALEKLKIESEGFKITNPTEKELAIAILRLPEQLELAVSDLQINRVCDLVYEIAVKIAEFYQQSKVVGSEEEQSRVLLLEATKKVMAKTFDLLGMKTIAKI